MTCMYFSCISSYELCSCLVFLIAALKNMATNGWNYLNLGLGAGATVMGFGAMVFRVARQIVMKEDLDEIKRELKDEIDKTRKDIKDDYKNIATKEDIEKLFNKLKPTK